MENLTLPTRILIVNESRIIRATLAKHLHEHYQFCEEADGEAGWKTLLADHSIQLVIAALTMPLLDGYNFLARIRSSSLTHIRDIPVLMISGDDEAARERVSTLGGVGFITKGIGSAALLTRIDPLVKTAAATQNPGGDTVKNQAQDPLPKNIEPQVQNPQINLFTRKYIELQTAQAMSKAMRQDSQISVMMVSLDRLTELREAYGDEVLEQLQLHLTKILTNTIRRQESFGHYGDNQLAIVLPDTSGPNCESYAERLREALKASNIALYGQRLNLSISTGVANSPVDSVASAGALLELASERLQRTQRSAENQTTKPAGSTGVSPGQPAPTLEQALNLLRTGHEDLLVPHLDKLGKRMLPLLYFLAEKLSLRLPMVDIERRLLELEREKEYGSTGPQ